MCEFTKEHTGIEGSIKGNIVRTEANMKLIWIAVFTVTLLLIVQCSSMKIISGTMVALNAKPYMALIETGSSICSGTLIANKWVLTAAHCTMEILEVLYSAVLYLLVLHLLENHAVEIQDLLLYSLTLITIICNGLRLSCRTTRNIFSDWFYNHILLLMLLMLSRLMPMYLSLKCNLVHVTSTELNHWTITI
ncbi:granzyme A-like [Pelobates cultripes]|uniref:Granzyme A-like n=1 Tax=Pelobates cultripes TaxID=61616 RepID=A0AAD1SE38_PELCU|nr:granzyme A-like [Pelobates cultripes]